MVLFSSVLRVLDEDLSVWERKGVVSQTDIEDVSGQAVRYQIIDHRLYRQRACSFPFRCVDMLQSYFLFIHIISCYNKDTFTDLIYVVL